MDAERNRLNEAVRRERHWRRWGPYLSERQWGTVREDYSPGGTAWEYFPFEHSGARAYRWGEDGLLGVSDNHQRLCLSVALWNGKDPILKERLFGLTNSQGNHGEDVKELYYYLDSTPTHSYLKGLYKYPQAEFPYEWLAREARWSGIHGREPELFHAGAFDEDRYWDVFIEYAKGAPDDILMKIRVCNRGPEAARLHVLPTVWFRNTWSWGRPGVVRPRLWRESPESVLLEEAGLGEWRFRLEGAHRQLFTENETNPAIWGHPRPGHFKDAFHWHVVRAEQGAVNPEHAGTKMAGWYELEVEAGGEAVVRCRLSAKGQDQGEFQEILAARRLEADKFFAEVHGNQCVLSVDGCRVQRQALAGLMWTKQYYHYSLEDWLDGDPAGPPPPAERKNGRNREWIHFYTDDILSMPDKWEYPWFAAWDTAFHMIPYALIDAPFAKHQLQLLLREWYMHPNGQMPAYEWALGDVNPPVHAWAVWRVYKIDERMNGKPDYLFLERCFHKLLMNFTWWVNQKDSNGDNIFSGGFLGLDNIGVFDRSKPLPAGGTMEQSDGTAWMAMYCLNMLSIAIELAQTDPVYEDIASKFFEHFLYIASAMNRPAPQGLWDQRDGFFYDRLRLPGEEAFPLRVRSLVGLIPLYAVATFDMDKLRKLKGFRKRAQWFIDHRPDLCENLVIEDHEGELRSMLSLLRRDRLERVLRVMFDEAEFLSPYGIRSLSRVHADSPYVLRVEGEQYRVQYQPAESDTWLFGGNSNWRGPVWFPVNFLIMESLQQFAWFYGDSLKAEFPTGSGNFIGLDDAAAELSRRLSHLFLRGQDGRRPCFGGEEKFQSDPHFRDYLLFHEYFHGDNGAGLGASHQTGWTALVAKLLSQSGE
jgi:hypothetical protein